jgi:pimeloyl-ACP methyl ester carboxylesterase
MFTKYGSVDRVAVNYFHTGLSTLPGVAPPLDRGELLLFLHGAGSNAHTWHRQLAHLEPHHSAVAVAFPAHGRPAGLDGFG